MYRDPPAHAPLAVVAFGRNVVALDRLTGKRAWEHAAMFSPIMRLFVTERRVYAVGKDRIVCLAYETGKKVWSAVSPVMLETVVLDGAQILGGIAGEVVCLSAETGEVLWRDRFQGMGIAPVAVGFPGNTAQIDRTG